MTEKWEFVLASIIAGVGFGFLLGAPLNMLVSEAAKQDYGTALGTLSLVRQMGMTLAPALYAGYITAGYENIGTHIKHKLNDAGITLKGFAGGETDVSRLSESLSQISDPKVKDIISEAIHESVGAGFLTSTSQPPSFHLQSLLLSAFYRFIGKTNRHGKPSKRRDKLKAFAPS